MEFIDIFKLIIGSGFTWGFVMLVFRSGKVLQKIENMDKKLDLMGNELTHIGTRLTRLEVRVEERTLRVIHTGTEPKQ